MRRRYVIGALLGGLLGFTGQFLGDFVCWGHYTSSHTGKPSTWYQYACAMDSYDDRMGCSFEGWLLYAFKGEPKKKLRAREVHLLNCKRTLLFIINFTIIASAGTIVVDQPADGAEPNKELSQAEIAFGETQLTKMIHDRPEMAIA